MENTRKIRVIVALMIFVLVFLPLLFSGVNLLVDWLWFNQEGYRLIYTTILKAQINLSGIAGLGFMAVAAANLLIAHSLLHRQGHPVYSTQVEFAPLERFAGLIRWGIWGGVLFIGYMVSQWSMGHWLTYLRAQHVPTMGIADPLFGRDLGFYLFQLPFTWFLYHLAIITVVGCLLSTTFLYLAEGGVWFTPRGPVMGKAARAHLMSLGGILFLLIAYRIHLGMYDLLYSPRGMVYGPGYTDVHATLPVLWILLGISILTAGIFFVRAATGDIRTPLFGIGALIAVGILGGSIYPEIVQRFVVAPNEIDKERPFIASSIEFTRKAYALDRIEEKNFSAMEDLTLDNIRENEATFRNVRMWDHKPLLTTFAQLQEIRTYYDFVHIDNDRYWIDGTYRQVSLSPRELNPEALPERNWINEYMTYTHGYGLCLGPVNEFTSEGLPVLFIKDLPPASNVSLKVTRPEIYFGEQGSDYCFVKTKAQEFDYPQGDKDVYTSYEGTGGIPVQNFWRRLLFAAAFSEKNILFSSDIQPDSRLMIYRKVLDRVTRLTPFIHYDHDPYMVITDSGALVWMLDGYTSSTRYPYSEPAPLGDNYIRNSVKATVNAYTGEVKFYISDSDDPFVRSYAQMFPGVFHPLADMPKDLRAHIRYPEELFSIQANMYAVFHMTDPQVFYNKEDLWRVAQSAAGGSGTAMTPYYNIMKLAEVGKREEFILMAPFTPARKDNMIAWMAARCDDPNYGKVLVFTFPKQKLIYGPQQIESRIDQEPEISQKLTLWGQGGSTVIRGTLLVTPVLNSVLYIEPLYLSAEKGNPLPQLQEVIVAYSDHVKMAPTLDAALTEIFGGTVNTTPAQTASVPGQPAPGASAAKPVTAEPDTQAMIHEANQHYEHALQLQRQGDWAGYGDEIKKLGEVLNKLAARQK